MRVNFPIGVLLLLLPAGLNAQQLDWAVPFATDDYCRVFGLDLDQADNVYVAAEYGGSGDLDPGAGTVPATAGGFNDLLAMKLDADGGLVWSYLVGGASNTREWCTGIVADDSGNSWMSGSFAGAVDFDPGPGVVQQFGSSNGGAFVLKLDGDGALSWVKSLGTGGASRTQCIARDHAGNILISGFLTGGGAFPFGADTTYIPDVTGQTGFVCKMTPDGTSGWVWVFTVSSTVNVVDLAADDAGNIFFTGLISGQAEFTLNGDPLSITAAGGQDMILGKLDAAGDLSWVRTIGGTGADLGYGVAVDAAGNVYGTGYFSGTVDLDPNAGTQEVTSAGATDIYLLKLDTEGATEWARALGSTGGDAGQTVRTDAAGNVYVGGYFEDSVDMDPGPGIHEITSMGGHDMFVASFGPDGDLSQAWSMGGPATDFVRTMRVDPTGSVLHIGGFFNQDVDFDPGPAAVTLSANADDAGVVARYTLGEANGVHERTTTSDLHVFPNPTTGPVDIRLEEGDAILGLRVRDAQGRLVLERSVPFSTRVPFRLDAAPGTYVMEVRTAKGHVYHNRVIKQ